MVKEKDTDTSPDLKVNKKPSLGDKILKYIPWRTVLTGLAFAIPGAGPVMGTVIGTLLYANHRKNNRTEDPTSKHSNEPDKSNSEVSKKENAQPGFFKKALFRIGAIVIGFLLGGPVVAAIAVALDMLSNGKFIQGIEKLLDVGYDALNSLGNKALDMGKWAVNKEKDSDKEQKTEQGVEEEPERGVQNRSDTPGKVQGSQSASCVATNQKIPSEAKVQSAVNKENIRRAGNTSTLAL